MRWLFRCVSTFTLTDVLSDKSTSASNLIVLLVAIAIILLGGIGIYILKNENVNLENKPEKNTPQNTDENTNFNEEGLYGFI